MTFISIMWHLKNFVSLVTSDPHDTQCVNAGNILKYDYQHYLNSYKIISYHLYIRYANNTQLLIQVKSIY